MSGIFGIGYGVRFRHLLSPRKSVITRTVLFFLGMMKVGAAHSEEVTLVKRPIDSRRVISSLVKTAFHKMVWNQVIGLR
jgi:hypothetical protein